MSVANKTKCYRALIYAPAFLPDSFSESITTGKLSLALLDAGWDIQVISRKTTGSTYSTEWGGRWDELRPCTHELTDCSTGIIGRIKECACQTITLGFPIAGMRWVASAVELGMRMHEKSCFDIVMSRAPQEYAHLAGAAFSKRAGVPWVANWNDPPCSIAPPPYARTARPWPFSLSSIFDAKMIRAANILSFPSERLRDHVMSSALGNNKVQTTVIPHVALKSGLQDSRLTDGVFRICHAGNLSVERDPERMFEGIAIFMQEIQENLKLEIKVLGKTSSQLMRQAMRYGVGQYLMFAGALDYWSSLREMAQSDVLIILEAPCREGVFLPGKLVDYAWASRAILAISPVDGTVADLVHETECGVVVDCLSSASIAHGLKKLYQSWRSGRLHVDFSTNRLLEKFSPETVVAQYNDLAAALIQLQRSSH